jgi:hypothetical protein
LQRNQGRCSRSLSHFLSSAALGDLMSAIAQQPDQRAQEVRHPPNLSPRLLVGDLEKVAAENHRKQQRAQQEACSPAGSPSGLELHPNVILPDQPASKDQGGRREDVCGLYFILQEVTLRPEVSLNNDEVFEDKEGDTGRTHECAS